MFESESTLFVTFSTFQVFESFTSPCISFICVNINNLLWHPAGEEAENQECKRKKTKTEQINVCSEITMNHKPIKPAWRDGRREEGRIGDSSNSKRTERRLKIANSEWQHRNTFWIKDWNIKIRKQRVCQKAKVVKYQKRWRGREKNKCKPLRIKSLISLWGRIKKKKRISTFWSSQPHFDISLPSCLIF